MTTMRALRAELSKLLSLPATWIGCGAGFVVAIGLAVTTSRTTSADQGAGFNELGIGVLGPIILGVVAISSEYAVGTVESDGGRQITTTMSGVPSRMRLFVAKALSVALLTALLAIVVIAAVFATHGLLGVDPPSINGGTLAKMAGVVAYWVLMALLALALTVPIRNGVLPLMVLVLNSSAVSVSFLLAQRIPAANYLPDIAGMRMFTVPRTDVEVAPVVGGIVMAAWVAVLLVAAAVVFSRRDA